MEKLSLHGGWFEGCLDFRLEGQVREGRKDRVCPEQGGQKYPSCLKLKAGPWGSTLVHRKQHTGMQKGLGTYLCTHTLLGLM